MAVINAATLLGFLVKKRYVDFVKESFSRDEIKVSLAPSLWVTFLRPWMFIPDQRIYLHTNLNVDFC